jgi:hypothetical protein
VRICFNRTPVSGPWGGGNNFVVNMSNHLREQGHEVVYSLIRNVDIIFMIDPRPSQYGFSIVDIFNYKNKFPEVKIIHRINECDKRKGTDLMDNSLLRSNLIADKTVFISNWLAEYFIEKGFNREYDVIYNGCNADIFYPLKNKKLEKPLKLVTHHWSDNWMKGFDIYVEIDKFLKNNKEFEFSYIGRYNQRYTPAFTKVVEPLHGDELGNELRKHDIYVTASRWEPCGMHHIEGAASGMPTLFHEQGGGINELCREHGYGFNNFESFLEKLSLLRENYFEIRKKINYENIDITNCCKKYYRLMRSLK